MEEPMRNISYIRTTALIDELSFTMLKQAGIVSENQRNKVLFLILKAVLNKYNSQNKKLIRSSVKYQSHVINPSIIHYEIDSDIYEACLDLRKINKLSVSKMINDGIKEFLDVILSSDYTRKSTSTHIPDNHFHNLDNYPIKYKFTTTYNIKESILTTIITTKTPPLTIQTISLHFNNDLFT